MQRGIDVSIEGTTVTVRGDLEFETRRVLAEALRPLTEQGLDIVADLRGVTFIDSSGMAVLINGRRRALDRGGSFTVYASGSVDRALTVAALDSLLGVAQAEP